MSDINEVVERSEKRLDDASSILNDLLTDPLTKDLIELPEMEIEVEGEQ